jgi:hypothetical protein
MLLKILVLLRQNNKLYSPSDIEQNFDEGAAYYSDEEGQVFSATFGFLNYFGGANIHSVQVLKSVSGYYIGTLYKDTELNGLWLANQRLSGYYRTRKEAVIALLRNSYNV